MKSRRLLDISAPASDPAGTALAEPLLTAMEVAAYLSVSKITIYDWAQKGRIPAFRLGHHWRFRRSEIEEWLDLNRQRRTVR